MLLSSYTGNSNILEAGCDEAGRGCLAGPVVAAAVILPPDYRNEKLNDSKKLLPEVRFQLREEIMRDAVAWAVAEVDNEEIDRINILNASFKAMHLAVAKLAIKPNVLLIDGNRFKPFADLPYHCVVKGDATYLSIAAASILAKTHRDELMKKMAEAFPGYGWETNVGYPTAEHREGIKRLGVTPLHRKTFQLLPVQLDIDFSAPMPV